MTRIRGDIGKYLTSRRLRKAVHISREPELRVQKLGGSHDVYLVDDVHSHKKFILKSFQEHGKSTSKSVGYMKKEYKRLIQAEHAVHQEDWVRVVKPYLKSDEGDFLAVRYMRGKSLGSYIRKTMEGGGGADLYEKLTLLAGFFGILHKRTEKHYHISPTSISDELKKHARQAGKRGAMTHEEQKQMERLIDRSCSYHTIKNAKKSLVHGDANPSNFLYRGNRLQVIDMERSGYRDPVYDLGMMAGELCHFAMRYGHDPYKADPFIGHLYWTYAGNFRDQPGTFIRLTKRNPLYMANSLFRIARHEYFSKEYKRRLAYQAGECLKSLKKFAK